MKNTWTRASLLAVASGVVLFVVGAAPPDKAACGQLRGRAQKLFREGNVKEAWELYRKIVLAPDNDPVRVESDLHQAVACLKRLNRTPEMDGFIDKAVGVHAGNWRLLQAAARAYYSAQHYGYIIAGEFHRGHHRGGGKYVNSFERDRVRTLQLMELAMHAAERDDNRRDSARVYREFARMLMGYSGHQGAWQLQILTDLTKLPDYAQGRWRGTRLQGAPVDEDGNPVYYRNPKSYESASSDGERWRYMLVQAVEYDPNQRNGVLWELAQFCHSQFGVQTMAHYSWFRGMADEGDEDAPYAVHTLADDETLAKLATGVKRFTLPEEFRTIALYRQIADAPKAGHAESALQQLAQIYENRRQYDRAAAVWKETIDTYGPGHKDWKKKRRAQILDNWGQFEPVMSQPAGKGATVDYRFRNGNKVSFDAYAVKVPLLLSDAKTAINARPNQLDRQKLNIQNIGYRLVANNEKRYVGRKVASWDMKLEPRPKHFDRRITVSTPLQEAGAYLLVAKMANGNTSRVIIWLNDTVIVKKALNQKALYFVADALTGTPVPKANVEFFGFRQERVRGTRKYKYHISQFAELTDENGLILPNPKDLQNRYQWLVIATTDSGRLAYYGFSGVWYPNYHDREYNQTKVFTVTDRPVYRPNHTVKFKLWVRHAKYDRDDTSTFANRQFKVEIRNPRNEKVLDKSLKTDAYGGFDGEWMVPADAALGVYRVHIPGMGGGTFRVEEYKKPEFEVTIEAPTEPVMLGEKIEATVKATYYFGAPVTKARAKIKVTRSSHNANWYPWAPWDWFYGPGYWWFCYDYTWYPGWNDWGCGRPRWPWWPMPHTPPEVVLENEMEIGEDGIVKVQIDTGLAKAVHGDLDHRYEITAEVTDESRRTIVGQGKVLVARKPFKVYAWLDRGHFRVGDTVHARFTAQTLDNKPVRGKGALRLLKVSYDADGNPSEEQVQTWALPTDDQGKADVQIKASEPGQFRLAYTVTDREGHNIEGGYVFCIRGAGFDGGEFRFSDIELVPDKKEYAPGEPVNLMVNTNRRNGTVLLFVRPANGVYLEPRVLRLKGKSVTETIAVIKKDMPNFFVEAVTVSNNHVHNDVRQIVVPPEKRVVNVEIVSNETRFKPGQDAEGTGKVTDSEGKPVAGSAAISVYDKSVEYISGGSNVADIKAFFWKWRRNHHPRTESSLQRLFRNLLKKGEEGMNNVGVFGHLTAGAGGGDFGGAVRRMEGGEAKGLYMSRRSTVLASGAVAAPMATARMALGDAMAADEEAAPLFSMAAKGAGADGRAGGGAGQAAMVQPTVRTEFADTAFWAGSTVTDADGTATVNFKMPENLTGWKIRAWTVSHGTKVGEGTAEVVTAKDLMLRLQAPRFFVEKDEVVLSANVHNYLKTAKSAHVRLELDGGCLEPMGDREQRVRIDANGEKRVDWRVKVVREGEAVVRMLALTDEESDAMEMRFPVYVHGMLKTESFSAAIRPDADSAELVINVPAERRPEQSRLEVRYSPTLAGAMVDALPYMVEYPYGCTEQTLNRFLPAAITQKILLDMGLDLEAIKEKQTNLNAQEIGDDRQRAAQWRKNRETTHDRDENRVPFNPVFDIETVRDMVKVGVKRLTAMQLSDGGWGWFSGYGERSYAHTTAYVVHGLQVARDNDVGIVPGVIDRGVAWLTRCQNEQVKWLRNHDADKKDVRRKAHADNLDAFVFMVLTDADVKNPDMLAYLYRDRNHLSVYGKAMAGMACHKLDETDKLTMIMRNIEQILVQDDENQTAYLNMPNTRYWWYWYGSEMEAHAYYLKLLAKVAPKSEKAARLVKYILNNRKHATYWSSTRDSSLCIEALADYLRASGEDKPDLTVQVLLDGRKHKEVRINPENLFQFDNKLVLTGDAIESGKHTVEIRKTGTGPLYLNAYLTNFTLEDHITRAGLEVKVNRSVYRLKSVDKRIKAAGSRGQVVDQKVEKFEREKLANSATLRSGDLVEIELEIESKNDYEYIVFEDMKAAGFEAVGVRSGYNGNDMGAYVEFRDNRVAFFVRRLARGKHSVSYRLRAEIPGKFSALPARAWAMYAPELKGNSDEIKLIIED